MLTKSFVDKCISGDALIYEIDEYIKDWHTGKYNDIPLLKFLGMTKKEYNAWMLDDSIITYIVKAHKDNVSFETIINTGIEKIAARDSSSVEVVELLKWLKENEQ
jgi:hypothetical protein